MSQIIDTPCIGICSTVYGDDICRGCKRHANEVIHWNQYSVEEKQVTYTRLNELAETVLSKYLDITNADLINHYADRYHIRRRPTQGIYSLLFLLLYWECAKIDFNVDHGFVVKPEYHKISLEKLVQVMDSEMYQASQV